MFLLPSACTPKEALHAGFYESAAAEKYTGSHSADDSADNLKLVALPALPQPRSQAVCQSRAHRIRDL